MPRVIHFEIHADNPERAAKFYSDIFGWNFQKWDGPVEYWLITTGDSKQPGINGGLARRRTAINGDCIIAYVCTVDVPSADEFSTKVTAAGGTIALPKMPVPGVGWLVYCKDTEGNVFGMMQGDPNAK